MKARSADLNRLADWLAEGKIEASVDATLPLDEVPAALATQEAGKVQGKLAVTVATH
ncbi:MAG: zinc-binding dehydrogenase [Deltaproteobacteria bacterium]|nr:zinc-binding dehydrogenase [Deltaproteobacteria bacterium]